MCESKDYTRVDQVTGIEGGFDPFQILIAVHICNETAWKEQQSIPSLCLPLKRFFRFTEDNYCKQHIYVF
jgi:hypothetical protein